MQSGIGIRVYPKQGASTSTGVRQVLEDIHAGTQYREKVGKDLGRLTIEFSFLGRGIGKFYEMTRLTNVLEDDEVWTLEAPSTVPLTLYKNSRRVALSTDGEPEVAFSEATGRTSIKVRAIVNGIWIADGGTYAECTSGSFTVNSTQVIIIPLPVYTRDSDGTVTGLFPVLRLPVQTSGYPLAVRRSDFTRTVPATIGSPVAVVNSDGITEFYQDYDMTSHIHPTPVATVGTSYVYDICSSPSAAFLGGGIDSSATGGIASQQVAWAEVGHS
jgi:hypothetical protein